MGHPALEHAAKNAALDSRVRDPEIQRVVRSANLRTSYNQQLIRTQPIDGKQGRLTLIWALFVVLLAGWTAGVVSGDSLGGGLHLLLLGAVALLFLDMLSNGRRAQD